MCESKQVVYLVGNKNLLEAAIKDIGWNTYTDVELSTSRLVAKLIKSFRDFTTREYYFWFKRYYWICLTKATLSLHEKCPDTEVFLVRIFLYLDWIQRFTYSVQIQGNTDQKNCVFGHFSSSVWNFQQGKKLRDIAFILRDVILGSKSTRLLENFNLDTIQSIAVTTASLVENFVQNLLAGTDIWSWKSHTKKRHIKSVGGELFPTSYGRKILSKHLKLRLAIKSLTGVDKQSKCCIAMVIILTVTWLKSMKMN